MLKCFIKCHGVLLITINTFVRMYEGAPRAIASIYQTPRFVSFFEYF